MSLSSHPGSRTLRLLLIVGFLILVAVAMPYGVAKAAAFTVDTTTDVVDANPGDGVCDDGAGNCSLRAAVMEANALAGADTIDLPSGTYTLTLAGVEDDLAAIGDLDVTESLTITGATTGTTFIDGASTFRVLHVTDSAVNLTLEDLTVQNGGGVTAGAGIYNDGGVVTLTDVDMRTNIASLNGGAIFNKGGTIQTSGIAWFSNNRANGTLAMEGGGAIYNLADAGETAWITTTGSPTFINNQTTGQGGAIFALAASGGTSIVEVGGVGASNAVNGGGLYVQNTYLNLTGNINGATASGDGGGIYAVDSTTVIDGATVASNTATTGSGGGIYISGGSLALSGGAAIETNSATADGGGIYALNAAVSMNDTSAVLENSANGNGGGLYLAGTATLAANGTSTLTPVVIDDNDASGSGGGIYTVSTASPSVTLTAVSLGTSGAGNRANDNGGGLYNSSDTTIEINYSIVMNNTADADTDLNGSGGGIFNGSGQITLLRSTVGSTALATGNTAITGGGIYNSGATAVITMKESQLTYNSASNLGGGVYNQSGGRVSGVIANNTAGQHGGGVYNSGAASVVSADIFNNTVTTGNGGGAYNDLGTVNGWYVSYNTATAGMGGGVYNTGTLNLAGQTVRNNTAGSVGGGVYNTGAGTVAIENATVSSNTATGDAGTIYSDSTAGTPVSLLHVTVYGNTGATTNGIIMDAGTATVNNSLILNTTADCGGLSSPPLAGDYNIVSDDLATCFGGAGTGNADLASLGGITVGDILVTAAPLETMKDDYDIDFTYQLINALTSSDSPPVPNPAIDYVDPANCTLAVDQRGAPRPIHGDRDAGTPSSCDAGAYEFGAVVLQNISINWWDITEGDSGQQYRIMAPDIDTVSGDISVTVTTNGQCEITAISSGTVNTPTEATALLTHAGNYPGAPANDVVVTLDFVDDDYVEDPLHYCEITHSAASIGTDIYYDGLPVSDLRIGILDNDDPGVTISPTTIGPITEGDAVGATYDAVLDGRPLPGQSITITPAFNSTQVSIGPASLTFDTTNWNVPQTFTVSALADNLDEGDLHASVVQNGATPAVAGTRWDGVGADSVTVSITDIAVTGPPIISDDDGSSAGANPDSPILLNISKDTQAVRVGDTLIWIFELTNVTDAPSADLTFTASFPDGLSIITAGTTQGTIGWDAQLVTAQVGVIAAGQTVRISVTTTVNDVLTAFLLRHGGVLARPSLQANSLCVDATVTGAMPGLPVSASSCVLVVGESLPGTGGQPVRPVWPWAAAVAVALAGLAALTLRRRVAVE